MERTLSCLHPNPGWEDTNCQDNTSSINHSATDMVGKHCILELYDCDHAKLNDEAFLRTTITTAAKRAGATLLNLITHRFEPQGVTGLALLAESHLSIHTELLRQELGAKSHALKSFQRETPAALATAVRHPKA